jgi:hypothetical protein
MNESGNFELLTLDEFSKRFGVCRTTVFEWKKRGVLKAGYHYILVGKVLRFFWDVDILRNMHTKNVSEELKDRNASENIEINSKAKNLKSVIDFDY